MLILFRPILFRFNYISISFKIQLQRTDLLLIVLLIVDVFVASFFNLIYEDLDDNKISNNLTFYKFYFQFYTPYIFIYVFNTMTHHYSQINDLNLIKSVLHDYTMLYTFCT